jgi:hypothetical protein
MAPVLKTGIPERVSGVQIPPSPPLQGRHIHEAEIIMGQRFFEIRHQGKRVSEQGYGSVGQAALSLEDAPVGSEVVEVTFPVAGRVMRTFNPLEVLRAREEFLNPQIR